MNEASVGQNGYLKASTTGRVRDGHGQRLIQDDKPKQRAWKTQNGWIRQGMARFRLGGRAKRGAGRSVGGLLEASNGCLFCSSMIYFYPRDS
jgi:hypothetical protein